MNYLVPLLGMTAHRNNAFTTTRTCPPNTCTALCTRTTYQNDKIRGGVLRYGIVETEKHMLME